jgi:hypothetical protein
MNQTSTDTASTVATAPRMESTTRAGRTRSPWRRRDPRLMAIAWPREARTNTPKIRTTVRASTLSSTLCQRCNKTGSSHMPSAPPERKPIRDSTLTTKPWR